MNPEYEDGGIQSLVIPETVKPNRILLINTRCYRSDLTGVETNAPYRQDDLVEPGKFFTKMLCDNEDLKKDGLPSFDIIQMHTLKRSVDQHSDDWVELAKLIEKHYNEYSGFVVQNGSDAMIYTATALSYMLENLGKPVIFTGSMIPGYRVFTDMKRNTIVALLFASCGDVSEVCIAFNERLLRANRSVKVSRSMLHPYATPHLPPLGEMRGHQIMLRKNLLRRAPHGRLTVSTHMSTLVLTLKIVPGIIPETLKEIFMTTKARAIVLLAFGSGNCPTRNGWIKDICLKAAERGVLVLVCSQNRFGDVDLSSYEAGRQLLDSGVLGVNDMTIENTIIKLKYLFGKGLTTEQVRTNFVHDLRGETNRTISKM